MVVTRSEQLLDSLENSGKSRNIVRLADDLPLFASVREKEENEIEKQAPALQALENLNPDDLTPKAALEKLYELKSLLSEKDKAV